MKKIDKLKELFLKPKGWLLIVIYLITLVSCALSIVMVVLEMMNALAYIVFVIAALLVAYTIYTIIRFASEIKESIMITVKKNKLANMLIDDFRFKTIFVSFISFLINLAFIIFNTTVAIISKVGWYGALAGYYLILSLFRGLVFYLERKSKLKAKDDKKLLQLQYKNYRLSGVFIILLELSMTAVVVMMILLQKPTNYTDILAITYAAYTFYKITFAIKNTIKTKKHHNPHLQTLRNISLVDAGITLLSLQITLVTTFSNGENMLILNMIVGVAICLLTIILGVYMIIKANIKLKLFKEA